MLRKPTPALLRHGSKGFSLVELLVAMAFISLLMVGMLQVYASSLKGFRQANETVTAQRNNRWALDQIQDDIQSAGYFFPPRPMPSVINPFVILPNNAAPVTTPPVPGPTDEVRYLADQPIAIRAQLSAVPAANNSISVAVQSGNLTDLQVGDYVLLMDSAFESVVVSAVTTSSGGGIITLDTNSSVGQDPATGNATGVSPGLASLTHQVGTDLTFIRPMQMVRYSIQGVATDPSNSTLLVPCLVRQQGNFPSGSDGSTFNTWAQTVVVAENVVGMTVDVSADGGASWARTGVGGAGTAGWGTITTNLNNRLATTPLVSVPPYSSISNAAYPLWYRFIPVALRLDLTTSTRQRLDQSSVTGIATSSNVYRLRKQTLMIPPRNFTYGL